MKMVTLKYPPSSQPPRFPLSIPIFPDLILRGSVDLLLALHQDYFYNFQRALPAAGSLRSYPELLVDIELHWNHDLGSRMTTRVLPPLCPV